MEVDLLEPRCGGVDLLDWYRGQLSTRRLALLVAELPVDSRVVTELRRRACGHDDPFFDQKEYLLADIFDVVNHHRWLTESYLAARGKQDMPKHPDPYPRPGVKPPEPEATRFASTQQLTELFGQ